MTWATSSTSSCHPPPPRALARAKTSNSSQGELFLKPFCCNVLFRRGAALDVNYYFLSLTCLISQQPQRAPPPAHHPQDRPRPLPPMQRVCHTMNCRPLPFPRFFCNRLLSYQDSYFDADDVSDALLRRAPPPIPPVFFCNISSGASLSRTHRSLNLKPHPSLPCPCFTRLLLPCVCFTRLQAKVAELAQLSDFVTGELQYKP